MPYYDGIAETKARKRTARKYFIITVFFSCFLKLNSRFLLIPL